MRMKILIITGFTLLACITGYLILFTFFSKETCIKLNNNTTSSIKLIKTCKTSLDTLITNIPPKNEICIGNWEVLFGKLENKGITEINERYSLLKVILPENSEIDLLKITPEYKISGNENQYSYQIK
ncbi:MAG: hypothetical protein HY951_03545 [Bacteroidia bacterium]|nr:hypothetical protein [Bacteroidia bacterium]